jgi:hypothetical protein
VEGRDIQAPTPSDPVRPCLRLVSLPDGTRGAPNFAARAPWGLVQLPEARQVRPLRANGRAGVKELRQKSLEGSTTLPTKDKGPLVRLENGARE